MNVKQEAVYVLGKKDFVRMVETRKMVVEKGLKKTHAYKSYWNIRPL